MLGSSKAHLSAVGESYWEHMRFAMIVGLLAIGAGMACMLHAIVPGLCERTCSRTVASLQALFADRTMLAEILHDNSALLIFVVLTLISCVTALVVAVATASHLVALILIPQAFALPLIFLSQNPQLDPAAA